MAKPANPEREYSYAPRQGDWHLEESYILTPLNNADTVKKFMDKRLLINVQGGRKVTGILRGFDIFLNLVLDEARDETYPGQEQNMFGGSTVRIIIPFPSLFLLLSYVLS